MPALAIRALFSATIFVAAALVFLVQPMVARELLPAFGGSPGVWNTTVVFFQLALLGGYALAHLTLGTLGPRRQALLQLAIAIGVFAFLPFGVDVGRAGESAGAPPLVIGLVLALAVGVPYVAVTMTSPVLQRWYAHVGRGGGAQDPYFLYTASNAGSLVGLLAYPLVLEPTMGVAAQERAWAVLFVAYAIGLAACVLLVRRTPDGVVDAVAEVDDADGGTGRSGLRQGVAWVLVAAIPSCLMLGVTTFISADVASAPFLWVLPLALYLASFMVTFGRRWRIGTRGAGIATAASLVWLLVVELDLLEAQELQHVLAHLAAMTSAALLCHAWLFERRPPARHLTRFYLLLSLGGVVGGSFAAIVAPAAFDRIYEYPLLVVAAAALRPTVLKVGDRARAPVALLELALAFGVVVALATAGIDGASLDLALLGTDSAIAAIAALAVLALRRWGLVIAATCLLLLLVLAQDRDTIHAERGFFGTLRVAGDSTEHRLLHGTTLHGSQLRAPHARDTPTTYYGREAPIGDAFRELQREEPFVRIGIVGLGTGSVVTYAKRWQELTFFEIDPAVIRVARNPRYFSYLEDAKDRNTVRIVEGDARLRLADEPDDEYDLLVLDAYSSDAVPVHLLTVEAFRLYLDKLAPGGRILLHVSSRHLDLDPVVAGAARRLGLAATHRVDSGDDPSYGAKHLTGSHWIVLARDPGGLDPLASAPDWIPLPRVGAGEAWTDDRSDVVGAIRWLH